MSEQKKKQRSASSPQESIVKQPRLNNPGSKLRKKPKYRSFRLHRRIKHPDGPLPSWWSLTKKAFRLIAANKRQIGWFLLVYGVLYVVFVQGFSSPINVQEIRDSFKDLTGADISDLSVNFAAFSLLLQSTTKVSGDIQGMYHVFFIVISILALIWLYRQQQAGNRVTMRQAFYKGMFPLVPFLLILFIMALQAIPLAIGSSLFQIVIQNDLAINVYEQTVWFLFFVMMGLLTLYMISSSLIGLFIVTIPDMTPKKALKKARELARFRRLSIMRKIAMLAVVLLLLFVGIIFPLIFVSTLLAQIVFYLLLVLMVPIATAYMFVLYRELL